MPLARTAWSRTRIRACSTEDHRLNRLFPHYVGQSNPQEVRTHNDDQKTGGEIVRKAISRPARQIAIKAGEDGSIVVGTILEKDAYAYGYDAQAGEVRQSHLQGHHRPDQARADRAAGRGLHRGSVHYHDVMVAELPKKQRPAMLQILLSHW